MTVSPFSLQNKCAVVFGGAGYLGSATVEMMLRLGAKVVVADLFPDFSSEQVAKLKAHANCRFITCDVSSTQDVQNAFRHCEQAFGLVNVMVNFAVYMGPAHTDMPNLKDFSVESTSDEDFDHSIRGVLGSSFRLLREAVLFLQKNKYSCIINTSSMYGIVSPDPSIYGDSGQNNPVFYGAGKAGVLQLTRYAAAHLAYKGIRVNCVTPGPFPAPRKLPPEDFMKKLAGKTMLGRTGKSDEIAGAYCYLMSDTASFTTGANIVVDGGWTAW